MLANLGPFLGVSVLLIISPGPDTALVLRTSLWGSRRAGAATAVGVMAGLATWTVAASLGLAALIRASEPAFVALKLVGAAYLMFLGGQALLLAIRDRGAVITEPPRPASAPKDVRIIL